MREGCAVHRRTQDSLTGKGLPDGQWIIVLCPQDGQNPLDSTVLSREYCRRIQTIRDTCVHAPFWRIPDSQGGSRDPPERILSSLDPPDTRKRSFKKSSGGY